MHSPMANRAALSAKDIKGPYLSQLNASCGINLIPEDLYGCQWHTHG